MAAFGDTASTSAMSTSELAEDGVASEAEATVLLTTWSSPPAAPAAAAAAVAASSASAATVATRPPSPILVTPPSLPSTSARFFSVPPRGVGSGAGIGGGRAVAADGYTPDKAATSASARARTRAIATLRAAAAADAATRNDPATTAAQAAAAAAATLSASLLAEGAAATGIEPSASDEEAARMAVRFLLASPAEGGLGLEPEDLLMTAALGEGGNGWDRGDGSDGGGDTEGNGDSDGIDDDDDGRAGERRRTRRGRGRRTENNGYGDDSISAASSSSSRRAEPPLYGPDTPRALSRAVGRLEDELRRGRGGGRSRAMSHGSQGDGGGGDDDVNMTAPSSAAAGTGGGGTDSGENETGAAVAEQQHVADLTVVDETELEVVGRLTSLVLRPTRTSGAITTAGTVDDSSNYQSSEAAHSHLLTMYRHTPRRVCQYAFRKNDIVWVCRTCQSDETCVLCHACYSRSDHEGHDVAFYHAQAGGCCDCGDPDAWDPAGFCDRHGPGAVTAGVGGADGISHDVVSGAGNVVAAICDWLVGTVVRNVEIGHARCNPRGTASDRDRIGRGESMPAAWTTSGHAADADASGLAPSRSESVTTARETRRLRHRPHSAVGISSDGNDVILGENMENADDSSMQESTPVPTAHDGTGIAAEQLQPLGDVPTASFATAGSVGSADNAVGVAATGTSETFETAFSTTGDSPEKKFDPEAASSSKSMTGVGTGRHASDDEYSDSEDDRKPSAALDRSFEFDPEAASTSKSMSNPSTPNRPMSNRLSRENRSSPAYRIGKAGREGKGLYLVLHGDDIHSTSEIVAGLRDLYSGKRLGDLNPAPFASGYTEAVLSKAARILRSEGDLIVWGTQELVAEAGPVQSALWRDGDYAATERMGALMFARAKVCISCGLVVSIKTRSELLTEQRAAAVIRWLGTLAQACDPLCHRVSSSIKHEDHLIPMLRADLKLPAAITSCWHSLLLTLLAVPDFKAALANAYCDTYVAVTSEYAKGVGVLERSSYTLSVQFLNRVTYVQDLVRERDLLGVLSRSLLETLVVAAVPVGPGGRAYSSEEAKTATTGIDAFGRRFGSFPAFGDMLTPWGYPGTEAEDLAQGRRGTRTTAASTASFGELWEGRGIRKVSGAPSDDALVTTLDPNHEVLTHRRYSPCVSDIKCVLNVPGMARLFASIPISSTEDGISLAGHRPIRKFSFLDGWIQSLALGQNMDGQVWRTWGQGHVELEPRGWVGAFNASISLGSLFERLLSWEDTDLSPLQSSSSRSKLLTCSELAHLIMTTGLYFWQQSEMITYHPTVHRQSHLRPDQSHSCCPAALPYCTVTSRQGTALAFTALPVSQVRSWSFHLPLHRFVASCLREVFRRPNGGPGGIDALIVLLGGCGRHEKVDQKKRGDLFRGLLEFPLIVLSRAAQIRVGLWKRNGPNMVDQVLNYSEPPFCRALRDADLTLVQFALIGCQPAPDDEISSGSRMAAGAEAGIDCAHLVNLILHRFGIFGFCGLKSSPDTDIARYRSEVQSGVYPGEKQARGGDSTGTLLPWTYSPAKDAVTCLGLLEEALYTLIILVTELPAPSPVDEGDHLRQAKRRLRREVIHKLVSGPKTHSELADVQHVLPQRDTAILSAEGKKVNPDDASGAALEAALAEVADCKVSRGKLAADRWEVRRWAWDEYDPAFFHISQRCHQTAAENRSAMTSSITSDDTTKVASSRPYAPRPPAAHPSFERLRRDVTADACVIALVYRTLHVHCRKNQDKGSPPCDAAWFHDGTKAYVSAYDREAMSETVLARAVHLLTLGTYAWLDDDWRASSTSSSRPGDRWRELGGGGRGSVFYRSQFAPSSSDWVASVLLAKAENITDNEWYTGEENMLLLLRRLADDGGCVGSFIAQDQAIRSGAAWICDCASKCSREAAALFGKNETAKVASQDTKNAGESDLERRKREARERAMQKMQANAARFAAMMEAGDDESDHEEDEARGNQQPLAPRELSAVSSSNDHVNGDVSGTTSPMEVESAHSSNLEYSQHSSGQNAAAAADASSSRRLLLNRPQCIIGSKCNNEDSVLAFCGYAQPSVVLKGGGGPPTSISETNNSLSSVSRLVGTHVTLCGHAVHSNCCDSYLKTVSLRDDRFGDRLEGGRRGEFRCPLCQRLSNCLVPFVDVGSDWADQPTAVDRASTDKDHLNSTGDGMDRSDDAIPRLSLHHCLDTSKWWFSRNDGSILWDGRCSIVSIDDTSSPPISEEGRKKLASGSIPKKLRRSVRSFGKKDLFSAWGAVFKAPRFARKKSHPGPRLDSSSTMRSIQEDEFPLSSTAVGTPSSATDVWRKFMDQVAEVSHRADLKRLGEKNLLSDFGEFRHYLVEKTAYNSENRAAGKEMVDWPTCISPTTLSDYRRQELSREKLICKLLLSIQAFTYTCCSEGGECLRLRRMQLQDGADSADRTSLFSKFGVEDTLCGDNLILLPDGSRVSGDGTQYFDGRIGKLRYLGLAIMVATSAVSREIVQLALAFPTEDSEGDGIIATSTSLMEEEKTLRAPIVYPILNGHILSHVVAAMCATCGRTRARNDFDRGSESFYDNSSQSAVVSVLSDCENFIKLGFMARTLQVLLGIYSSGIADEANERKFQERLCSKVKQSLGRLSGMNGDSWEKDCLLLMQTSLSLDSYGSVPSSFSPIDRAEADACFDEACAAARIAAMSFLSDVGLILQVVCPGASTMIVKCSEGDDTSYAEGILGDLMTCLRVENISDMIRSPLVKKVLRCWYKQSRPTDMLGSNVVQENSFEATIPHLAKSTLDCDRTYPTLDWPQGAVPAHDISVNNSSASPHPSSQTTLAEPSTLLTNRPVPRPTGIGINSTIKSKKVPLFGGRCPFPSDEGTQCRRIRMLPKSYTDLYAELGALCPDSEQTAICLVCGMVLNAGGKGECTKHAVTCGAGVGIFFLLQECIGLMIHGTKAAYIHSPYVDSHGETPHYRGRPLNLDMDRYQILYELWTGHLVREKVIAERGSSRQVIIANFY